MFDKTQFERIVGDALEALPEQFRYALDNVAIVVEDEPTREQLDDMDLGGEGDELFGLYQGVPLTEREHHHMALPDRIVIFRGPLLRCFHTPKRLGVEIRRTVIHELGHHMGLSDEEMPY
jgi:predicted Zn-dependent protease with MMP-like domain